MDQESFTLANLLLGNPPGSPALELLMGGIELEVIADGWIALAGADLQSSLANWHVHQVKAGQPLLFPGATRGLWSYLAVPGGFKASRFFGSTSTETRTGLGLACTRDTLLTATAAQPAYDHQRIRSRSVPPNHRPVFGETPRIRFHPGPQWNLFSARDKERFVNQTWRVSSQSNRVGYRLEGTPLESAIAEQLSEPTLIGTIQVPPGGTPLILMRDGPTLGGYPKLGIIDSTDLNRLAQCPPGRPVHFHLDDLFGPEL